MGRVVDTLACLMTILQASALGLASIADSIAFALLRVGDHPAVGGLLNPQGFHLLWMVQVPIIGAVYIWRGTMTAIWITVWSGM